MRSSLSSQILLLPSATCPCGHSLICGESLNGEEANCKWMGIMKDLPLFLRFIRRTSYATGQSGEELGEIGVERGKSALRYHQESQLGTSLYGHPLAERWRYSQAWLIDLTKVPSS